MIHFNSEVNPEMTPGHDNFVFWMVPQAWDAEPPSVSVAKLMDWKAALRDTKKISPKRELRIPMFSVCTQILAE